MGAGLTFQCSPQQCNFLWAPLLLKKCKLIGEWTMQGGEGIPSACLGGFTPFLCSSKSISLMSHMIPPYNFVCGFVFKEQRCFYCGILAWVFNLCWYFHVCSPFIQIQQYNKTTASRCYKLHVFVSDFPLLKSLFALPFPRITSTFFTVSVHFWILVLNTRLICDAVASWLCLGENYFFYFIGYMQ